MLNFLKVADGLYALYVDGVRVTPEPLTREELDQKLLDLELTDADQKLLENFYNGEV